MQSEIDAAGLTVDVSILGVNELGFESGNTAMTNGRDIPWLGVPGLVDVAELWSLDYRDVVILDRENRLVTTYNLTVNDLSMPANYDSLKQQIFDAARGPR